MSIPVTPFQLHMQKIEEMNREAARLKQLELVEVIKEIKHLIGLYGLTATDLGFNEDRQTGLRVKYLGPLGEKWAGRGKMPRWASEAIANGARLDDFLVDKKSDGTS